VHILAAEIVAAPTPYEAAIVASGLLGEHVEVESIVPAVGRPSRTNG
jgi:hypothetical protein